MQQPPGYEVGSEEWVKELLKAIYGLKQAGRKWYDVPYRLQTPAPATNSTAKWFKINQLNQKSDGSTSLIPGGCQCV